MRECSEVTVLLGTAEYVLTDDIAIQLFELILQKYQDGQTDTLNHYFP